MTYILKHPIWFSNRPRYTTNKFGISPSSRFIYKENEMESYANSASMMSQALLYVSDQVAERTSSLIAKKNSDSSYTDGKHIVVGMNPMKEYNDLFEGMDIEMGLACHEACHCAYTDFNDYTLQKCKYPIAHWIHNVYEDECIEEMLGVSKPQWMYFLNHTINHYFNEDKLIDSIKKTALSSSKLDVVQLMILYMVRKSNLSSRFPKEWIDEFGPMLDEIYKKVIQFIEDPKKYKFTPTEVTSKATLDTIEIIKKYVSLDDLSSKLHKPHLGMIGNSSSEGNPNQDKNCGFNGLFSPNTKEGRSKSSKSIKTRYDKAMDEIKNSKDANSSSIELFKNANKEIGAANPSIGDIESYNRMKSNLKSEISLAKKIIIPNFKKIELEDDKFHRNGQLINSHLVQAIQGVNCVYHRKVVKTSENNDPKYAFVIAIDESGSMAYCEEGESPASLSSKLSCIFYEAMKDFPGIDLYVYGHGDNVVKYITPKDKNPGKLGRRMSQNGQNESKSYNTILNDVRLQTNKPIFFLNITDSMYLSNHSNIISVIDEWEKKKVLFGLLSIASSISHIGKSELMNDEIYEDRWFNIKNDKNGMKEALNKFSKIIRKKYDVFK